MGAWPAQLMKRTLPSLGMLVVLAIADVPAVAADSVQAQADDGALATAPSDAMAAQDAATAQAVREALQQDALLNADLIQVAASRGMVKLDGRQPLLLALDRAVEVAEAVPGVRQVVDSMELWPRREVDGARLEADIVYALLTDPTTDRGELTVEAGDFGDVTLRGTVDSGAERRAAELLVKSIAGVQEVANEIQVNRGSARLDGEILDDVRRTLQWNARVDSDGIDVSVRDGVVTLAGEVGDGAQKRHAALASWVAGVAQVNTTALKVVPTRLRSAAVAALRTDAEIEAAVRRAIQAQPRLSMALIDVSVGKGVVTLLGTVASLRSKRIAHDLPLSVLGVRKVRDRIKIGGLIAESYDEAELRVRVERALSLNSLTADDAIRAQVRKGAVTLTGKVDRRSSREAAESLAESVPGVRSVKNQLIVAADSAAST